VACNEQAYQPAAPALPSARQGSPLPSLVCGSAPSAATSARRGNAAGQASKCAFQCHVSFELQLVDLACSRYA